jgi:hypothetical protein
MRPVAVILVCFIVGYVVVALVSRFFQKKPPVSRRGPAARRDPMPDQQGTLKNSEPRPWGK